MILLQNPVIRVFRGHRPRLQRANLNIFAVVVAALDEGGGFCRRIYARAVLGGVVKHVLHGPVDVCLNATGEKNANGFSGLAQESHACSVRKVLVVLWLRHFARLGRGFQSFNTKNCAVP